MIRISEIHTFKVALQEGICTAKQVLFQLNRLKGGSLLEKLLEVDLLTESQWDQCLKIAKIQDQYPDSPENIKRDNQILFKCFQEQTWLSENLLQEALRESQKQIQTSPKRIDEILLAQKHLSREDLSNLEILEHHPLLCQTCQYAISLARYYYWHEIPCLFCSNHLMPTTPSNVSQMATNALLEQCADGLLAHKGSMIELGSKDLHSSSFLKQENSSDDPSGSSKSVLPQVGEQFGKYKILAELGKGGMGAVYKVYDPDLDREVALKTLLVNMAEDPDQIRRFQKEAQVVARLSHKNIANLYEFRNVQETYFFTMDYVEGMDLFQYVQARGKLSEKDALDLVIPIAHAVVYAHEQGVIHRDIKPSNIMVQQGKEPILMDFGLAKQLNSHDTPLTATGTIIGTAAYMAPEQARGRKDVGYPADQYALGGVLFFLLIGRPPFLGKKVMRVVMQVLGTNPPKLRNLRPEISPDMEAVVLRCLEKEPEKRYPSVEMLLEDLKALKKGNPIVARP